MSSDALSRRTLLMGAAAFAGSAITACGPGKGDSTPSADSAADSTTTPAATTTTTTASTSADVPSTSRTEAATTTTTATTETRDAAWADVDFGELEAFLEVRATNGFAIVENGVRVHEWYRSGSQFGRDVASAQKSVLSLLVGRAVADGLVSLDTRIDDVLGADWTTHGQTSDITVRHLLTMTSGLDDTLNVVSEPGTDWMYSGAFAQLFYVLTEATGRELNDIADDWLFTPAGAVNAEFYERQRSQFAPIGLYATVDDLVAIGQAVLDPTPLGFGPDWLSDSFTGIETNESYGYMWWLNNGDRFRLPGQAVQRPGTLIPAAPSDMVSALGKDGQKLYVIPNWSLVVTRLGDKAESTSSAASSRFDNDLWLVLSGLRA